MPKRAADVIWKVYSLLQEERPHHSKRVTKLICESGRLYYKGIFSLAKGTAVPIEKGNPISFMRAASPILKVSSRSAQSAAAPILKRDPISYKKAAAAIRKGQLTISKGSAASIE